MKIEPFKEINPPDKNGYWTNKKTGETYGGTWISPLLIPNLRKVEKSFEKADEENRVWYVGVTRTSQNLYIMSAKKEAKGYDIESLG